MAALGYLPKLKKGLRLAFGAHLLHDFSIKMFLINTQRFDTKFQCHPFSFLKILNKMCYQVLI